MWRKVSTVPTDSEGHEVLRGVVSALPLAVVIEEPFRVELTRVVPVVLVEVDRLQVADDHRRAGDAVIADYRVLSRTVRYSEWYLMEGKTAQRIQLRSEQIGCTHPNTSQLNQPSHMYTITQHGQPAQPSPYIPYQTSPPQPNPASTTPAQPAPPWPT